MGIFKHEKTREQQKKKRSNQKGMLHVTPAQHPYFLWLRERQWSKLRRQHPSELCINSRGDGEKYMFYPARPKEKGRGDNPQWTTIMSHRVACYSKGAELASSSAADVHLFWHFLSTLTQKTHDNATLCISKVRGCLTKLLHEKRVLVPMIPKTTFHTVWRGRNPWRSPIDMRRDGQKASH